MAPASATRSIATRLRQVRRRESRCAPIYAGRELAQLWQFYIQLVEAAFKNLKHDRKRSSGTTAATV